MYYSKALGWKTGAGVAGHEFPPRPAPPGSASCPFFLISNCERGRPFAYLEFPSKQAGKIGGCQAEAHTRVTNGYWSFVKVVFVFIRLVSNTLGWAPSLLTVKLLLALIEAIHVGIF